MFKILLTILVISQGFAAQNFLSETVTHSVGRRACYSFRCAEHSYGGLFPYRDFMRDWQRNFPNNFRATIVYGNASKHNNEIFKYSRKMRIARKLGDYQLAAVHAVNAAGADNTGLYLDGIREFNPKLAAMLTDDNFSHQQRVDAMIEDLKTPWN